MLTPSKKINLILLSAAYWLAEPFVEYIFYTTELSRGSFPVDADSISIPIIQFTSGWVITAPFIGIFVWWSTRHYPGGVPVLGLNQKFPIFGAIFWLLTSLYIILELIFIVQSIIRIQPIDVLHSLFGCYLALMYNGVLQAREKIL